MPWEKWSPRRNLKGESVSDTSILRGDEYLRSDNRQLAQKEYQKAYSRRLSADERQALVMRMAGNAVALGQSPAALKILSDHFRATQTPVSEVQADFSLLFGYAYGDIGNIDQSLAWFSRARSAGGAAADTRQSAEAGIQALLRSLSEDRLNQVDENFSSDAFVNGIVGRERSRRAHGGSIDLAAAGKQRFWQTGVKVAEPVPAGLDTFAHDRKVSAGMTYPAIGVLLPLSGKYGGLGSSVKGGIELALEAANAESTDATFRATFRDSGGNAAGAVGAAADLVAQDRVAVIIGPLLSEEAGPVADTARQNGTPLLAFTKASGFQTGAGVFRLGPTVESQVDSLLTEVAGRLNLHNFAVVYPEDSNGNDFALAFTHSAREQGLNVLFSGSYAKDDPAAMLALAGQLESYADKLEAVFLPDSLQAASRFSGALSARLRSQVKLLGTASWDNPAELSNSRTALQGAIFVSPFFSLSPDPVVRRFVSSFEARHKRRPDFLAAQGFDAAVMVLAAAKRQLAGDQGFSQAFSSIEIYSGLTGEISVMPSGDLRRRFKVVALRGDMLSELQTGVAEVVPGRESSPFKSSYIEEAARKLYGDEGLVMEPGAQR